MALWWFTYKCWKEAKKQRQISTLNEPWETFVLFFLLLNGFDSIDGCVLLLLMERLICFSSQYCFLFCSSISPKREVSCPLSTSDLDAHTPPNHCNPVYFTTMHVYIFWLFCSPNKAQIIHTSSQPLMYTFRDLKCRWIKAISCFNIAPLSRSCIAIGCCFKIITCLLIRSVQLTDWTEWKTFHYSDSDCWVTK